MHHKLHVAVCISKGSSEMLGPRDSSLQCPHAQDPFFPQLPGDPAPRKGGACLHWLFPCPSLLSESHSLDCTELEEIPHWLILQSLTQNGWNFRMEKVGCSTNKREGCSSPRCVPFGVSPVCSCVSWSGKEFQGFCDLTRLLDCDYRL